VGAGSPPLRREPPSAAPAPRTAAAATRCRVLPRPRLCTLGQLLHSLSVLLHVRETARGSRRRVCEEGTCTKREGHGTVDPITPPGCTHCAPSPAHNPSLRLSSSPWAQYTPLRENRHYMHKGRAGHGMRSRAIATARIRSVPTAVNHTRRRAPSASAAAQPATEEPPTRTLLCSRPSANPWDPDTRACCRQPQKPLTSARAAQRSSCTDTARRRSLLSTTACPAALLPSAQLRAASDARVRWHPPRRVLCFHSLKPALQPRPWAKASSTGTAHPPAAAHRSSVRLRILLAGRLRLRLWEKGEGMTRDLRLYA
jgi:hypothetical protein